MNTKRIVSAITAVICLSSAGVGAWTKWTNLFSGRATVVKTDVLGINLMVADTGELPSKGGSIDKSNQGVNIPGVLSTGLLTAKTSGSRSTAQSLAGVLNLNLTAAAGLINVTADVINAKTKAMCNVYKRASVTGGSQIAFMEINGTPIEVTGDPNQKVVLPPGVLPPLPLPLSLPALDQVVTLVINEQVKTQPASNRAEIKVNAVHLTVQVPVPLVGTLTLADLVLSHAKSDIICR